MLSTPKNFLVFVYVKVPALKTTTLLACTLCLQLHFQWNNISFHTQDITVQSSMDDCCSHDKHTTLTENVYILVGVTMLTQKLIVIEILPAHLETCSTMQHILANIL